MRSLLVVLDSNIIISSLLHSSGSSSKIIELWRKQYFQVLISNYILSEVKDVLRDKQLVQKYHLSPSKQTRLLSQLYHSSQLADPKNTYTSISRDPKDNPIVGLALVRKAQYLVTGDQDLLALTKLKAIYPLKIISSPKFVQLFMNSDDELLNYLDNREKK
ncbi:MAG: putative toxin-antitoxin system toxin component, PIN family [bacterium]